MENNVQRSVMLHPQTTNVIRRQEKKYVIKVSLAVVFTYTCINVLSPWPEINF